VTATRLALGPIFSDALLGQSGNVLREFLSVHRETLIARCREKVARRPFLHPTARELLPISRRGVEANGGKLSVRNAGMGCVFTVDLPRPTPPVEPSG